MITTDAGGHPPRVHGSQVVARAGASLDQAAAAMILVHGRGASAENILSLAPQFGRDDVAYLAPQAAGNSWYPLGFQAPIEANEPALSSALDVLAGLVETVAGAGITRERIVLLGFSQGACLTLEFAARNARPYGGVVGFTGGLIGPVGTARDDAGDFAATPMFLGSSIPDPHVPWGRVEETARVLQRMGAAVDVRGYPGMPHTINAEEISAARAILDRVVADKDAARGAAFAGNSAKAPGRR